MNVVNVVLFSQLKRNAVSGKLSFNEVWKLLKRLNLQISQDYAMAMFMVRKNIQYYKPFLK